MANYGQMSMNNLGMNINTVGVALNNNTNGNTVPVNGINNIALPTRVNVINNPIAVGNAAAAATTYRNVNGNYGMVNIANTNVANLQLRNGINTATTANAASAVNTNRIVGVTGLTYANGNPAVLQQRVAATQLPATNVQATNLYTTYPLNTNANIINVGKKNLSPVNSATTPTTPLGNVGQRLVQTYSTTNLQAAQLQKPLQINTVAPQNIQLVNQNTVLTTPTKTTTPTLVQPPPQPKGNITPPIPSTTTLKDKTKIEGLPSAVTTPVSMAKDVTAVTINEKLGQTPMKNVKNESITTPVVAATTNTTLSTLTPNSEGTNEVAKLKDIKKDKSELNNVAKPALSTPTTETKDLKKTSLPSALTINNTTTLGTTSQPPSAGLVTPTNTNIAYSVANNPPKKTGSLVATGTAGSSTLPYNQGQNMYQKQYIATAQTAALNYPQTAVGNNYQMNKAYYPAGTNQTAYLNQLTAVKSLNGTTVGIPAGQQQKYYTIANGTYSNVNGTVQTGIKTLNPTNPVSYAVGNNQKYVISNTTMNNTLLNNRVQGYPINNSVSNVYQVANNNTVKVNGYIPNNGQVVMNTINNGQVSYVKVNPTVNGNVISNATNLVNYNNAGTAVVNNGTATTNPYLNKTALPNTSLLPNNVNGGFVKPMSTTGDNTKFMPQNPLSSYLLTPPTTTTTTTTSSRRRSDILRPPNPFILYRQEHHSKVLAEHEGISNTEISKIIGKMWKNESEEVKNKYKEKAQEMKRRHKLMYPDYRFAPRKQEEIRRRKKRKNINPNPETTDANATGKDGKTEDKKENKTENSATTEPETTENAKKKLKKEESTEVKKDEKELPTTSLTVDASLPSSSLTENDLTSQIDDKSLPSSISLTNSNIPVTTDDSSSNIITSTSLFSDLDSSLSNINSFDIENFDIAEDNSFIDNYLNFNSNHTFQTTSDSMFNQLTDLLNNSNTKK